MILVFIVLMLLSILLIEMKLYPSYNYEKNSLIL